MSTFSFFFQQTLSLTSSSSLTFKWVRTIISPGRCSLLEFQAGVERRESYVSRNEKKTKDLLDDEIKLAVYPQLESLANIRGCAPASRDVRGGEVRFENS